jgi:hypothetical protein
MLVLSEFPPVNLYSTKPPRGLLGDPEEDFVSVLLSDFNL